MKKKNKKKSLIWKYFRGNVLENNIFINLFIFNQMNYETMIELQKVSHWNQLY